MIPLTGYPGRRLPGAFHLTRCSSVARPLDHDPRGGPPSDRSPTSMSSRTLISLLLFAGVATAVVYRGSGAGRTAGSGSGSESPARARRVVLVVCDTLRPDRLGCYGSTRGATPQLDAFSEDAVRYEKAFAQSSKTMPSMASLLTGRTVDEIGVGRGNRFHIAEAVDTLAEQLQRAGLVTGAVVSNPVLRAPDVEELGTRGIAQGFDHFDDDMSSREKNRALMERVAPDTTQAALGWIDDTVGQGRDDFFLWVHYIDPHGPYTPPVEFEERFAQEHPADAPTLPPGKWGSGLREIPAYQILDDERRPAVYVDRYDAEVAYMDRSFGDLIDGLASRGLLDDTLLIFTADHGESLGEEDWWFSHGYTLHSSNVQVPLLIRFPGGGADTSKSGGVVSRAVQHLDVSATILDAVGARLDGDPRQSLMRALPAEGRAVIQQMDEPGRPHRWVGAATERWHLLEREGHPAQLFDLLADPRGAVDVAAENPEAVEELRAAYRSEVERIGGKAIPAVADLPKRNRRSDALKALGYGGDG